MWLFKRKKRVIQEAEHARKLAVLRDIETKRYQKAVKPIKDFNDLLEENGIILQIRRGLGNKHV